MAKFEKRGKKEFNPITDTIIEKVRNDAISMPMLEPEVVSSSEKLSESILEITRVKREKFTKQMRYQVTPTEEEEIKQHISKISKDSGSRLTHSNIIRSCINLILRAEEKIIEELSKSDIQRPVNEQFAILEFEEELSDVLLAAFRQTPLRE